MHTLITIALTNMGLYVLLLLSIISIEANNFFPRWPNQPLLRTHTPTKGSKHSKNRLNKWHHSVCTLHTQKHPSHHVSVVSWNRAFVSETWAQKHCIQTHTLCHSASCHFLSCAFVFCWFLSATATPGHKRRGRFWDCVSEVQQVQTNRNLYSMKRLTNSPFLFWVTSCPFSYVHIVLIWFFT